MAKKRPGSSRWRLAWWRPWVQLTLLLAWLDPMGLRMHFLCGPVFHCHSCLLATFACPIGVLANFSAIQMIPFAAIGMLLALGAVFGSFICGWACPFGFLQDLVARIPTRKFAIPGWLGYVRYIVLVVFVLLIPYVWGEGSSLFFCRLCPAGAIEAALPYTASLAVAGKPLVWPTAAKTIILVVLLVAMLFTWRPWCTVLCPLGAIYSMFNQVSFLFVRFHQEDRCKQCEVCQNLCRDGRRPEHRVDSMLCVRCLECTRCHAVSVETALTRLEERKQDS